MTDTIDNKIADSLTRILERWNPVMGEQNHAVLPRLHNAIVEEIEWLRAP